jgi:hypothetical protein
MARTIRTDLTKLVARRCDAGYRWLRRPAGAKAAKAVAARAVPPTSWDDIIIGNEAIKQARRAKEQ